MSLHRTARAALLACFLVAPGFAPAPGMAPALADDAAAPLPRRGFLGASLTRPPEGVEGVLIQFVIPDTTAADAGLQPGDVVTAVNGARADTPLATAQRIGRLPAGAPVELRLVRDGEPLVRTVALRPRPEEESAELEVIYDDVAAGAHRLRTIMLKPRGDGPFPAVLHLQGLSCASIDYAFAPDDPSRQLVYGMSGEGFVTMRVEKSGVGDSEGPDCREIGLHEEVAGFRAALAALRAYDFVDGDRVFLFGHSMGGVIAPIIAPDAPVRGVMVYGTIAKPFVEYMVENYRRQEELGGAAQPAVDAGVRARLRFWHHFYLEDLTASEIFAAHPDLAAARDDLGLDGDTQQFGRHVRFFRELSRLNLAARWAEVETRVLAIHGAYDWVSGERDHALIAEVVNARRPGTARWVSLPRMDHGFLTYDTLEASYVDRRTGPFDPAIVETTTAWMREVLDGAPESGS